MMSVRDIRIKVYQEIDKITEELVEASRNGDASYNVNEVTLKIAHFLAENPNLQLLQIQAAEHYKGWERSKIPPTKNAQGEFAFGYQPKGVIVYGKNERGFMQDMTFPGTLQRMSILQDSLKNTTDAIHSELKWYNDKLQHWDQAKFKTLDEVMRQEFGWIDIIEPPPEQE